jgi:Na+/citrate or Na+/malate symporter
MAWDGLWTSWPPTTIIFGGLLTMNRKVLIKIKWIYLFGLLFTYIMRFCQQTSPLG